MPKHVSSRDSSRDFEVVGGIEGLAQSLGLKKRGKGYRGTCPLCDTRTGFKLAEGHTRITWHCFGCEDGDAIASELVSRGLITGLAVQIDAAEQQRRKEEAQARRLAAERKSAAEQAAAQRRMRVLWDNSTEADPRHPYVERKQISVIGLRQHGDQLLIPLYLHGKLHSIERIYPDGSKKMHDSINTTGAYHPIRGAYACMWPDKTGASDYLDFPTYIAEGYATGWSLHCAASFYPVLCAMSAGNLYAVGKAFKKAYPHRTLIVAADNDTDKQRANGTRMAIEAAKRLDVGMVMPDQPGDFNDEWIRTR